METRSPSCNLCSLLIFSPLTETPLRLPRSARMTPLELTRSTACRREIIASSSDS